MTYTAVCAKSALSAHMCMLSNVAKHTRRNRCLVATVPSRHIVNSKKRLAVLLLAWRLVSYIVLCDRRHRHRFVTSSATLSTYCFNIENVSRKKCCIS